MAPFLNLRIGLLDMDISCQQTIRQWKYIKSFQDRDGRERKRENCC